MEKQKIRERLWHSLEMDVTWARFAIAFFTVILAEVIAGFRWYRELGGYFWWISAVIAAAIIGPVLVFCILRTLRIMAKPEDYFFCKARLTTPHGGPMRHSMYFSTLLEDPEDGSKIPADTHAIFYTHGSFGPTMEHYANSTVTIACNRETGMVVVIG